MNIRTPPMQVAVGQIPYGGRDKGKVTLASFLRQMQSSSSTKGPDAATPLYVFDLGLIGKTKKLLDDLEWQVQLTLSAQHNLDVDVVWRGAA